MRRETFHSSTAAPVAAGFQRLNQFCHMAGIVLVTAIELGCGSGNLPEMGTVSGVVTLDGKPVPDAVVRFQPNSGRGSRAKTNAEGYYNLGYVGSAEGALIGEHKVTISTQWMDEDRTTHKMVSHPETLPARYNSESDLTRTVEAGHNEINFELTSK